MRAKQVWEVVPLPQKLKLVVRRKWQSAASHVSDRRFQWDRLTFSRLTTAYFAFSVVHCILQLSLQIWAFTINAKAASFLYNLALSGGAVNSSRVPDYKNNGELRLCGDVPAPGVDCDVIWAPKAEEDRAPTDLGTGSPSEASEYENITMPASAVTAPASSSTAVSTRVTASPSAVATSSRAVISSAVPTSVPLSSVTSGTTTVVVPPPAATADNANAASSESDSESDSESEDDGVESDSESEFGEDSDDEDEFLPRSSLRSVCWFLKFMKS
jgi:hypothetical protein